MPELTEDMFDHRPRGCKTGRLLEELDEKSRAVLDKALANTDLSDGYIVGKLQAAGFEDPPKETSLRKHRSKKCQCRN